MVAFAAPSLAAGGKLHFAFDEDEATLLWDAAAAAGLAAGTHVACYTELPTWWWKGTKLVQDSAAPRSLRMAATSVGPVAWVDDGTKRDPEGLALAALSLAPMPIGDLERVQAARDRPDGEAEQPLGAYVTPARHEHVLIDRMRISLGRVVTWTRISVGAAPTEFLRLQDAVGDYFVVMVEHDAGRTVGIWSGATPPSIGQSVRPLLRRLFRQQGAWRYGIKFGPTV